jgi:hypothetical protein
MGNRLYVANLPYDPNAGALRAHFEACGAVGDVQIVTDKDSGRLRASAFVTMTREADAKRALSELNGVRFNGQLLRIESAPDKVNHANKGEERNEYDARAKITTQFRESANMTYEIDCAGTPLIVRVFFPAEDGSAREWRIVVQERGASDATSAGATAVSRTEALRDIARACRDQSPSPALAGIDWSAVEQAMAGVRAL